MCSPKQATVGGPNLKVFGAWIQLIESSPIYISEIQALVDVKAEEPKKKPDCFGVSCLTYDLKAVIGFRLRVYGWMTGLCSNSRKKRELAVFNLLLKYVKEPSAAESFIDILLPCLAKKRRNFDTCVNILQIIGRVVTVLGSGSSKTI
ncbi:hypothetical protein OROMI_013329 [Orobanche minor]